MEITISLPILLLIITATVIVTVVLFSILFASRRGESQYYETIFRFNEEDIIEMIKRKRQYLNR